MMIVTSLLNLHEISKPRPQQGKTGYKREMGKPCIEVKVPTKIL